MIWINKWVVGQKKVIAPETPKKRKRAKVITKNEVFQGFFLENGNLRMT